MCWPLKSAMQPRGMYLGVDPENGWSLRTAGEFLLFGGAGHRTGENRAGGRYDALLQKSPRALARLASRRPAGPRRTA